MPRERVHEDGTQAGSAGWRDAEPGQAARSPARNPQACAGPPGAHTPERRTTVSLTIELSPAALGWLNETARRQGKPPQELAASLVESQAQAELRAHSRPEPLTPENDDLLALLQQWREEDATDDPEELAARDRDLEDLKRNLNANRAPGERPIFP